MARSCNPTGLPITACSAASLIKPMSATLPRPARHVIKNPVRKELNEPEESRRNTFMTFTPPGDGRDQPANG